MSKRPKYWGYIRKVLYDYPRMRVELDALREPLQSVEEQIVRGSGNGRTVERLSLAALPGREQEELEAVEATIREMKVKPDGPRTVRLIQLVFFRGYSIPAAAQIVGWSPDHAYRKQAVFLHLLAKKLKFEKDAETGP